MNKEKIKETIINEIKKRKNFLFENKTYIVENQKKTIKELILKVDSKKDYSNYFYNEILEEIKKYFNILNYDKLRNVLKDISKDLNIKFKNYLKKYIDNLFFDMKCDEIPKNELFDKDYVGENKYEKLSTCNSLDVYNSVVYAKYNYNPTLFDDFFSYQFNIEDIFKKLEKTKIIRKK